MTNQGKIAVDTLLAESLKELVLKIPFEKITIKDITDRSGVIRPTFYNHFQDKYELLEKIIVNELIEPMDSLLRNNMIEQGLIIMLSNMKRDKEFYMKISKLEGQNSFEGMLSQGICRKFLEIYTELPENTTEVTKWLSKNQQAEFYANSLYFIIFQWIQGGMEIEPVVVIDTYLYLQGKKLNFLAK